MSHKETNKLNWLARLTTQKDILERFPRCQAQLHFFFHSPTESLRGGVGLGLRLRFLVRYKKGDRLGPKPSYLLLIDADAYFSALREANIYEPQTYRHLISGMRIERELDVAAALDAERANDPQRRRP